MYRELEEPRLAPQAIADADGTTDPGICICVCREPQPADGQEAAPTIKDALDAEVRDNIG